MKIGKWTIAMPYGYPDDGTGSGAGGGTGQAGTGAGAAGTGDGTAGATGTTGATGTQATGGGTTTGTGQPTGKPSFTYEQDRTDWVPPHRFRQVSQQARQAAELQGRLTDTERRLQALAGVTPARPGDQEAEQVRNAFKEMFPHLGKLDDAKIEKILRLAENSDQIETTTNHYWQGVGQQMVGSAHEQVADALGIDELTPSQQRRVGQAYVAMLNDDFQQARAEGRQSTMLQRHEARDPKLIAEFVKAFTDDFIEPVRRRAVQTNVERVSRRVPSGRGATTAAITTKPKIDFTNEQAVEDAAVASFTAHGGAFRR